MIGGWRTPEPDQSLSFFMQISERELEDYMFEDLIHNQGSGLASRGIELTYHHFLHRGKSPRIRWLRQVDLGPYGRLDIVGYYRIGYTVHVELFELKIPSIKIDDIEQICRYECGIRKYFGRHFTMDVHKYLVGSGFESGHFIHNQLYDLKIIEFEYDLSGICFSQKQGNWHRVDDHLFNPQKILQNG